MDFFFADDSRQNNPTRNGMGPIVAIGGIHIPDGAVLEIREAIDQLCDEFGFPIGEEFKWSPGRELWMRDNLVGTEREEFFIRVLDIVEKNEAKAIVVLEDRDSNTATGASSAEVDVSRMLIERVNNRLRRVGSYGVVIVDRPTGNRRDEDSFLADCFETLQEGTQYVMPDRIVLNVLSTPSKYVRLLQVADVVTGCTVAIIGGEGRYAPRIFPSVKQILDSETGRIGGVGLKIHPDGRYANLYHWLLEDTHFWKRNVGRPLPLSNISYSSSPDYP